MSVKKQPPTAATVTGLPLWFLLRRVGGIGDVSPIKRLYAGAPVWRANLPKCDIAHEFLYRVVRRYPNKILACDWETQNKIELKARCALRDRWPDGLGLLTAVKADPFGRRVMNASSGICAGDPEWVGVREGCIRRRRLIDKKSFQRLSQDQQRAAILIAELEGYLYATPWIRREKDRRAKELARIGCATGSDHVRDNQQ